MIDQLKLFNEIQDEVKAGYVNKRIKGDLRLYTYSFRCEIDDHWTEACRWSRGIIFDIITKKVVACPFPKFFNFGDKIKTVDELPNIIESITEKMDGSLGICYWYNEQWNFATKGCFDSPQAIWAEKWAGENMLLKALNKENTYLFEIIYPDNRIVVDYNGKSGLSFLAVYDNKNMKESVVINNDIYYKIGKSIIKKDYGVWASLPNKNQIKNLLEKAETLPGNKEGWVVKFTNGLRVKIKGGEYKRIHRLIGQVTPKRVWELMLRSDRQEEIVELREKLPPKIRDEFNVIANEYEDKYNDIRLTVIEGHARSNHWTDKEVGLSEHIDYKGLVFMLRKNDKSPEFYDRFRKSVYNNFKPKNK